MKAAALCGAGFWLISATASGQSGSEALQACALPSYTERMRCLERLAGGGTSSSPDLQAVPAPAATSDTAAPPPASPPAAADAAGEPPSSRWIVSETRSPVDYSPVAIATTSSSSGANGVLQLSIECRGGRTEMVIRSAPMMRGIENHVVSYRVNDGPPVAVTIGMSSSGSGIALKGDVPGFLLALPPEGAISFRVAETKAAAMEAKYDLPDLKVMTSRMVGPCNWRRK